MSEAMTQNFVFSFLSVCEASGLSKEAAASLLHKESEERTKRLRGPAFTEGYERVMEKSAYGRLARIAGGAGAAGLAALGGKAAIDGRRDSLPVELGQAPTLGSPASYTPNGAAGHYAKAMQARTPGIYANNKAFYGTFDKRQELQDAINRNVPGSHLASKELRVLKSDHARARNTRRRYFSQLDDSHAGATGLLADIEGRQKEIDVRRTSLMGLPQRLWLTLTGRNPTDYYNDKSDVLEEGTNKSQTALELISRQRRLLGSGDLGPGN